MSRQAMLQNVLLMLLIMSYFMVAGADVFGKVVVAATAFAAPPRSLSMFQGEYGYDSARFWSIAPNIVMVLFLLTLFANWRTPRRPLLVVSFAGFLAVAVVSAVYIFPEFRSITAAAYSEAVDPELQARGAFWQTVDLLRWLIYVAFGALLLIALRQPAERARPSAAKGSKT